MKTLSRSLFVLAIAASLTARSAAPNVTALGAWSVALKGPARLAADAAGNLYVTEPSAGRVTEFNAFGQRVATHEGFAGPLAIAVASDGRIYLSDEKNGSVNVFDPQWNLLYQLGTGAGEFQLPGHLAVDPQVPGLVYVSDGRANVVRIYSGPDLVGQFGSAGTGNGQFDFPAGIAVRANGEVLVVDQNNDRVEVFTNGVYARKFKLGSGGMFGGPSGRSQALFVDSSGRAFVADSFQGMVKVFNADTGSSLATIGGFGSGKGNLNLPLAVTLDSVNRLCVASANNARVELFGVDDFLHVSTTAMDGSLAAGQELKLSVLAGGTNASGFQWRKDGVEISGATNGTMLVAGASTGDSGNYSVVIATGSGMVTSGVASVSVLLPPSILSGPLDRKVLAGDAVGFNVIATGSDLKYQWYFNGQLLTGRNDPNLLIAAAEAGQAGQYSVRVSNTVGSQTAAATLTVTVPPLAMDLVSATMQPDQSFQLTANVDAGFDYELQATTNFMDWETLANFAAAGMVDITDTSATNAAHRFYRLRWAGN